MNLEPNTDLHYRVGQIAKELERAIEKFPEWPTDPLHALAVLQEEVGELQKEVLQMTYEPHKTTHYLIEEEAIQTAAMALRFLLSLKVYQYRPCESHRQEVEL